MLGFKFSRLFECFAGESTAQIENVYEPDETI